jgi:hypothetical protein
VQAYYGLAKREFAIQFALIFPSRISFP